MKPHILLLGNPILEAATAPITDFGSPRLNQLVNQMFDVMHEAHGLGLAAPQIGVGEAVTVIHIPGNGRITLINPELLTTQGEQTGEEGCLSIPGFREQVSRAETVTVGARDFHGKYFEITAEHLLARAFQHEIDHLNGRLYIAHLNGVRRRVIRRQFRRARA